VATEVAASTSTSTMAAAMVCTLSAKEAAALVFLDGDD
jgi:hypothetical protein